jgi:adenylosuccinate lyase
MGNLDDERVTLEALGPLDGRYAGDLAPLRELFCEGGLIRRRVWVEVRYADALTAFLGQGPLDAQERERLYSWAESLGYEELHRVKAIEAEIRHDVKAVERFLGQSLPVLGLGRLVPWVHWGLTSEDVDNLAYGLMVRDARDAVILPAYLGLLRILLDLAEGHAQLVMPGRTHGQIAVPTTVGKELVVAASRAAYFLVELRDLKLGGKVTGAIGNWNAQHQIYPERDWIAFSEGFVRGLGFEPASVSTQVEPGYRMAHWLDLLRRTNLVWLGLALDVWLYLSLGDWRQKAVEGEVGSSTMPHKVNPIDLENAEGNLQLANALLSTLADKVSASRLQRDLSDKTAKRCLGVALGHSLLGVLSLRRGLERAEADEERLMARVQEHPEVLAEGLQLLLRARGDAVGFERVQSWVRGRDVSWADLAAAMPPSVQTEVAGWRAEEYVGLAPELTLREVARLRQHLGLISPCGEE